MLFVKKKNGRNKIVKYFIENSILLFLIVQGFISRNDMELIMKEIEKKRFIIKNKSMEFLYN